MTQSTVVVVDDHDAMRDALLTLLESVDIDAIGFDSGERLLEEFDSERFGCAMMDVCMPGIGGLALARQLHERCRRLPIVFISAHADVRLAVEAMRAGAEDFIEKPFRDHEVIDRVQRCLELDRERRVISRQVSDVHERLNALSARERLVLERMLRGEPNKEIAAGLYLSRRTIETHRAHLMKKMKADSLATLVSMVTWAKAVDFGR